MTLQQLLDDTMEPIGRRGRVTTDPETGRNLFSLSHKDARL